MSRHLPNGNFTYLYLNIYPLILFLVSRQLFFALRITKDRTVSFLWIFQEKAAMDLYATSKGKSDSNVNRLGSMFKKIIWQLLYVVLDIVRDLAFVTLFTLFVIHYEYALQIILYAHNTRLVLKNRQHIIQKGEEPDGIFIFSGDSGWYYKIVSSINNHIHVKFAPKYFILLKVASN